MKMIRTVHISIKYPPSGSLDVSVVNISLQIFIYIFEGSQLICNVFLFATLHANELSNFMLNAMNAMASTKE